MIIAFVLMGLTLLALLTALVLGGIQAYHHLSLKWEVYQAHKMALIEDKLLMAINDKMYVHPEPNYRHNLHCPVCGRFSKRVMGLSDVVECKSHGIQVRWKDIPVEWDLIPLGHGVQLGDPIPMTSEIAIVTPTDTGPIWIGNFDQDVEDLLELESIRH